MWWGEQEALMPSFGKSLAYDKMAPQKAHSKTYPTKIMPERPQIDSNYCQTWWQVEAIRNGKLSGGFYLHGVVICPQDSPYCSALTDIYTDAPANFPTSHPPPTSRRYCRYYLEN